MGVLRQPTQKTVHRQSNTARLPRLPPISPPKNRQITLVFAAPVVIVRARNMGQNLRNQVTQSHRS
jgi:hypothetical protein